MKHSAIILAGGKSSRMNYINKAFMDVHGMPMIHHMLDKLRDFDEIIIVTNTPEDYAGLGVRVVTDILPQKGPLSGMHSGLIHAKYEYSFITACDTPFVPKEYVDYCKTIEKGYDAAIPRWGSFFEPTCGMYSKTAIDEIEKAIKAGVRKPVGLFPNLNVHHIKEETLAQFGEIKRMFTNINTLEDLDNANGGCGRHRRNKGRLYVPNLILIGSTGKNSGKTFLGTQMTEKLARKGNIEVLKIATINEGATCIYGEEGCGICECFRGKYKLEEETQRDSGKDTSLYLTAGAKRAVFLKSTPESLRAGFENYLKTVPEHSLIVCESNSLGAVVEPGIFIMIQGTGEIKPSAQSVMKYADVVYKNVR